MFPRFLSDLHILYFSLQLITDWNIGIKQSVARSSVVIMNQNRDVLKALLTANVSSDDLTMVHLEPAVAYIEGEMQLILQTLPVRSLITINVLPDGPTATDIYELLFIVVRKILEDSFTLDSTVDDIAKLLVSQTQAPPNGPINTAWTGAPQQLAVASIGWATLLFTWQKASLSNHFAIRGGPSLDQNNLHLETCGRPIHSFIRFLTVMPPPYSKDLLPENLLYSSILNFHTLVHIGRIWIEWVPQIGQHLVLHIPSRTLRLFKYPSLCILALLGGDYQKLSNR